MPTAFVFAGGASLAAMQVGMLRPTDFDQADRLIRAALQAARRVLDRPALRPAA